MKANQIRLWPGVIIILLQLFLRFVLPEIAPGTLIIAVFSGLLGGFAIIIWWVFFSRAPIFERWFAIVLMIAALLGTSQILDKSIATANVGLMFLFFSIPVLSLAFVIWAVATRKLSKRLRIITMVVTIVLASGFWALLRTNGMDSEVHHDLAWRWAKTDEDRLLSKGKDELKTIALDSAAIYSEAEWPGFRGRNRDGIIHGVKIRTDWSKTPPVEMWRRSIGPGCSSFAVHGNLIYTQEQRGEFEMVTCYNLNTGEPVWMHSDSTRFWDSHAGAGPRSTPTLSKGRVYTLGATGILNVLEADDGSVVWSRNAEKDTDVKIPGWGYTSSPLVVDNVVIVAIASQLVAYNIENGNMLWTAIDGGECYSSPHLFTINGVNQVIFMHKEGITSFSHADGKELWKLPITGIRIVQPARITDSDILVDVGDIKGLRRITVKHESGKWITEEGWSTNRLRPNHSDLVIHKGNVYGFEGPCLTCVDIEKGSRKWIGGRYGGQLILLADQDLLLVLSEEGELALVKAIPEKFEEIANFPAIEGKTWNHPVLVGDIIVVRNTTEMAAFRLSL